MLISSRHISNTVGLYCTLSLNHHWPSPVAGHSLGCTENPAWKPWWLNIQDTTNSTCTIILKNKVKLWEERECLLLVWTTVLFYLFINIFGSCKENDTPWHFTVRTLSKSDRFRTRKHQNDNISSASILMFSRSKTLGLGLGLGCRSLYTIHIFS